MKFRIRTNVDSPRSRSTTAKFLATSGLVIAFSAGGVTAATAGTNDGACDTNEVCVYKNSNLGTPRSDFLYYYADMDGGLSFHTYNYPSACNTDPLTIPTCRLNDSISSVDSWSDHRSLRIFTDANYDGYSQKIGIYGRSNLVTYNDQTSSLCWNDGGVPSSVDTDCQFAN